MATRNPNSRLVYTIVDNSAESSTIDFSAVEYNALTFPAYLTDIGEFRSALQNISAGQIRKESMVLFDTLYSGALPPPLAKREIKWLVSIEDDITFAKYRLEIPCARDFDPDDGTPLKLPNSDEANLNHPKWVDFIAKLRDVYRTPNGNYGTVRNIRMVGRNL